MDIAEVQAESRQRGKSKANDRLRRRGMLPGVIYGHHEAPELVAVSKHDLALALDHSAHVVSLKVDGQATQYLIKDVQYDYLQEEPIHVDFMRVGKDERVQVRVPLEFKGDPKGVDEGGMLLQLENDLEIECTLLDIPSNIVCDVSELGLNESVYVKDLPLPPGVVALMDSEDAVAICQPKREVEEPEEGEGEMPAAEGAEPEVIGRAKEEEADEGGE